MLCVAGKQRQEDSVISKFHKVTIWLGGSAVICVEDEEEWGEDTALRRASEGEEGVGQGAVHQQSELVEMEACDKLLSQNVWLHGV